MGRKAGAVTAFTLLALAAPAGAAELTRVASSGEPTNPFDLDVSIRWERSQREATITREVVRAGAPLGTVDQVDELRASQVTNVIVPRIAVGLFHDLELHVEVPYHLGAESAWRYATVNGVSVEADSTIANNGLTPDGGACATTPCPIFPVPNTVYQGGVVGDIVAGIAWGILSDRRDDTKPTWVVGIDATFPSAKLYDPAAGRDPAAGSRWLSPYSLSSDPGPVGRKIWKYDLYTALSRRMGPIDPYFRAHVTGMQRSSGTFSNCDQAALLAGAGQASSAMVANCALPRWKDEAKARLPFEAGMTFGAELVPYEDAAAGQKLAFDLRLSADYTSTSRWYNELTDATGKLLSTGSYVTALASAGLLFRASSFVALRASASYGMVTPHFLTGEPLGTTDTSNTSPDQNPNFDWRYDAPGRRFRLTDASVFDVQVSGMVQF